MAESILAIDPGPTESALVTFDGKRVVYARQLANDVLLEALLVSREANLAIEMVESFGMAVGREVFETVYWIGRFCQAFPGEHTRIGRKDIKLHLCGSCRAKDPNVRQALLDRFGGKEAAIGRKATPGPLHGVHSHLWAALAVAVYWWDCCRVEAPGELATANGEQT